MRVWQRRVARSVPADHGFTVVEVVVSLVLLTMVMASVSTLFMHAVKDATGLDRRQVAVSLADQYMQGGVGISATRDANGNSTLISGRFQQAVDAQWAVVTADLSQTDQEYDTTATASSSPVYPLTRIVGLGGVTYTVQRIVGSCWRPSGGGDCVKAAAKAASSQFMYRIIIQVTWSEGTGTSCSGSACHYELATLVDPGGDPTFNVNALPARTSMNALFTPSGYARG